MSSFDAASERRRCEACRPLHYDKPGSFKVVHESGGGDLGDDLTRVVDALAAPISQCEGKRAGKVGGVGAREGFGRVGLAVNSCKLLQWFSKAADGFHNLYYANRFCATENFGIDDVRMASQNGLPRGRSRAFGTATCWTGTREQARGSAP